MEYGRDYYMREYRTEWTDTDNTVVGIFEKGSGEVQAGIVEVTVFKTGERQGEAYVWNLHVAEPCRGRGYGRALLSAAYDVARLAGCRTVTLEWDERDTPRWVLDWYVRQGFDEREFGRGCAFMAKAVSENVTTTNPKTE